jgi:UDP-N-acetylglucosamine 2-epimerase (non-hydrolysing)
MKVLLVVGARPNFMKAAPLLRAFRTRGIECVLVHTGQHFDRAMSDAFFESLGLPEPDVHLGIGGGTRASQFARIVAELEAVLVGTAPDRVIVVGDVTSTAAAAVAADLCDVPVDHVEAGLRSFDLSMPEERNRRVADALAANLFVSEPSGVENLLAEGKPRDRIHLVGNVMIDTLENFRERAVAGRPWENLGLERGKYAVLTVHRPANVDTREALNALAAVVGEIVATGLKVVFPVHPRTAERLSGEPVGALRSDDVLLVPPMEYVTFLGLVAGASLVATDSGGLQEETTVLDVPCLTLRENTERPVTLRENGGSSVLVGLDPGRARGALGGVIGGKFPTAARPALWDGHAAERIASVLAGAGEG